ncbi:MAG: hypothetical protein LBU02_01890 [Rickettsiales bacterium]|jgi:hypothetical protein|nr:hypothetical protein [Rickettsiales bacterium]
MPKQKKRSTQVDWKELVRQRWLEDNSLVAKFLISWNDKINAELQEKEKQKQEGLKHQQSRQEREQRKLSSDESKPAQSLKGKTGATSKRMKNRDKKRLEENYYWLKNGLIIDMHIISSLLFFATYYKVASNKKMNDFTQLCEKAGVKTLNLYEEETEVISETKYLQVTKFCITVFHTLTMLEMLLDKRDCIKDEYLVKFDAGKPRYRTKNFQEVEKDLSNEYYDMITMEFNKLIKKNIEQGTISEMLGKYFSNLTREKKNDHGANIPQKLLSIIPIVQDRYIREIEPLLLSQGKALLEPVHDLKKGIN